MDLAQLAFFQAQAELSEVAWEGLDVGVIVFGVFAEIGNRQFACRPGFVKRMIQQVVLMNAFFELRHKRHGFHRMGFPNPDDLCRYNYTGGHRGSQGRPVTIGLIGLSIRISMLQASRQ